MYVYKHIYIYMYTWMKSFKSALERPAQSDLMQLFAPFGQAPIERWLRIT